MFANNLSMSHLSHSRLHSANYYLNFDQCGHFFIARVTLNLIDPIYK